MDDEPKRTLVDGSPISADHRELKSNGQQKDYVVLSAAERAKGFVRPLRDSYVHVGRKICGKYGNNTDKRLGGTVYVCIGVPVHEGPCISFKGLSQPEAAQAHADQRLGGCGALTKMNDAIAETYARDPKFYSGTFCIGCRVHRPLNEFFWDGTTEQVGS